MTIHANGPRRTKAAGSPKSGRADAYDIALRDFGLLIGALALGRLAAAYDPPLRLTR